MKPYVRRSFVSSVLAIALGMTSVVAAIAQQSTFVTAQPGPQTQISLNYNLNALYHGPAEEGPLANNYHSIEALAIVYNGSIESPGIGVPGTSTTSTQGVQDVTSTATGLAYHFISTPNVLDTVALTKRNGSTGFPVDPNGKNYASDTTVFATPILLNSNSAIGVVFDGSNGGVNFDMVLGFTNGNTFTVSLNASDWANNTKSPSGPSGGLATQSLFAQSGFGMGNGFFDGVAGTPPAQDQPTKSGPISLIQSTVTRTSALSARGFDLNGLSLNSITFNNLTSPTGDGRSSAGIYAVTVQGAVPPVPTPEPGTTAAFGIGAAGLCLMAMRRARRVSVV